MGDFNVSWKMPGLFNGADAEKCYAEIGTDSISPERVLDIAKNPDSELHKCFEWDDSEAAKKYRLQQASLVIRQLVVVPRAEEAVPRRVFQISSEKHEYKPAEFFVKNQNEYEILLERARHEATMFANRYRHISELEDIISAIDSLLA